MNKTTSTDIEELRKDITQICKIYMGTTIDYNMGMIEDIMATFAPHLSNKSELKKEAVRGFAKWLDLDKEAVYKMPHFIQEWAEEYLSSDEKEESEK